MPPSTTFKIPDMPFARTKSFQAGPETLNADGHVGVDAGVESASSQIPLATVTLDDLQGLNVPVVAGGLSASASWAHMRNEMDVCFEKRPEIKSSVKSYPSSGAEHYSAHSHREPVSNDSNELLWPNDAVLTEAFSAKNLNQDLLRCAHVREPGVEYPDNGIHYLVTELARAHRFLKLRPRWRSMKYIADWTREMYALLTAVENEKNGLQPWEPLSEVLNEYVTALDDYQSSTNIITQNFCRKTKTKMVDTMIDVTVDMMAMESELQCLMADLPGLRFTPAIKLMKQIIDEDCEEQGSLLLWTIPETEGRFRTRLSSAWTWTD
ncbi:hypothetical protein EK21DRAFT_90279 [Setomelanomma holmii]|uniref:Uncharacterized protein n=1 Tax=Setomelanomma holmii TaxID=210430 RepID=A0A9P4H7E5_9PLEO|nr:hypothetical protein EK21DRAFT_90279 [Setomelanomma holmii]